MITIEELFRENRFPSGWKLVPVLIYLPVGLVLATIRICIGLQIIIATILLYKYPKIRLAVLRIMWGILGVFVFAENREIEDETVKVIVSNHVTVLDHLAIHLIRDSVSVNISELPLLFRYALNYKNLKNYRNLEIFVQRLKGLIIKDFTVDIQPEIGITSGQKGLLRFTTWPCRMSYPIQPVAIKVWRPSWMDIAPSVVNTNWFSEVFWFLFVPFTFFTVKFLPVVRQTTFETSEEMTKRLEKVIASELKISPTGFTATDKVEYEKRLCTDMNMAKQPKENVIDQNLMEMATKVKEVIPYVPYSAIFKDLERSGDIDLTIGNFLEELVPFPPAAPTPKIVNLFPRKSVNGEEPSTSLDTSSKVFHKSSEERMLSFQERKLRLIENARQRYIKKHSLNVRNIT